MMKIIFFSGLLLCASFCQAQTGTFQHDGRADVVLSYPERGTGGRAIVHDANNILTLNYEGDFTGGSKIGKTLFVGNNFQVGIGTSTPREALHIENGSLLVKKNLIGDLGAQLTLTNEFGNLNGAVRLNLNNGGAVSWIKGIVTGANISTGSAIAFGVPSTANEGKEVMRITGNGFLGIGTSSPEHKLDIVGTARAHQIIVNTQKTADFVFEPDYINPSLEQIDAFITTNKHLPGIQSAVDMEKNGLNVGQFQIDLLQKIEELTLHLIEKNKEMKDLKENMKVMQQEIESLKKMKSH
ncbi:hypothetical protein OKW96_18020 [Sphingobacterium sp. KU25419]|nr:hypothetical protein OKW96_18020 [Sphingobacterium sp. KU25419]